MKHVVLLMAGALIASAQAPPSHEIKPDTQPPPQLREIRIEQKLNAQIPLDLEFRDETGRAVKLRDYFHGKPVILSLAYYECPMLCTVVLNGLERSLRMLSFTMGREFEVVTVSINPKETPELAAAKKASHLENYRRPGAGRGWHFLTGREPEIRRLAGAVGFHYAYDPATGQYAHAAGVMIATPKGRLARYFYGVEYPPQDLKFGLIEASDNRIGSPADQVLLYCYHYDAVSGKYTPGVLKLVRAGGVATVLGFVLFVVFVRRRTARGHRWSAAR